MRSRRRHSLLYLLYLRSPVWRLRRRLWILGAWGRCERCGSRRRLTIHHRTYRRLGHERRADVEVLCWSCHRAKHGGGPTHLTPWRRRFVRAALWVLAILVAMQLLWALAHGVPHR
jgi:5-methylcytosine-specific restriction endonuclease McrA